MTETGLDFPVFDVINFNQSLEKGRCERCVHSSLSWKQHDFITFTISQEKVKVICDAHF